MTLAKTCHVSNMMQYLEKSMKAFWIAMFQCFIVVLKKWISSWNLKYPCCMKNVTFVSYTPLFHTLLLQISWATFLPNII